jgi:hypothetical protein
MSQALNSRCVCATPKNVDESGYFDCPVHGRMHIPRYWCAGCQANQVTRVGDFCRKCLRRARK